MSKGRLQSPQRKTRRSQDVKPPASHFSRFIGVSLSGGKADKACIAVVEYYPEHKKVFLSRLFEKIKSEPGDTSADLKIHQILSQYENETVSVAFDVPLQLPECVTCVQKCPGYEVCNVSSIKWLREHYERTNLKKKPKKIFTPYTQRCAETYLAEELEEPFELHHPLGSNLAPLTARARFIARRLKMNFIEVIPKLSIWRLGLQLKVNKSHLRFHRHAVDSDESRRAILQAMAEKLGVFIYQQDLKAMIDNNHAFEAFISAYTGFLAGQKLTEKRPAEFPKSESWIEFPLLK